MIIRRVYNVSEFLSPIASSSAAREGFDQNSETTPASPCHGIWYDAVLVVPSVLFLIYLMIHARKNLKKLYTSRSYVIISYYTLLWAACLLNLAWCSLQTWQCSPGKKVAWNFLSLFTSSGMLCLEISLVVFLLQENYAAGLESLAHNFIISGIIVGVDLVLKAIYVFGFGVPLFMDGESTHRARWSLWLVYQLLLTTVYGFILFFHFSKWREKLSPRPAFYNYVVVMFVVSVLSSFACGLAAFGATFGIWLYSLTVISYHSLYLPFIYVTFLADFFQEEDFLLDNVYYSEMRDAGFFDSQWD